jgi:hypothetical protein
LEAGEVEDPNSSVDDDETDEDEEEDVEEDEPANVEQAAGGMRIVPLSPEEFDELERQCEAWQSEDSLNELLKQVLRALHELDEFRLWRERDREATARSDDLALKVRFLEDESKKLATLLEVQKGLLKELGDNELKKVDLGEATEELKAEDLMGMFK